MDPLPILSLGAGVQSTTLAMLGMAGVIEKPVAAIFADTGDEPEGVYRHLEWIRDHVDFPIHTVKQGNGLGSDFLAALSGETKRASQPPFYVRMPDLPAADIAAILKEPEPTLEDYEGQVWEYSPDRFEDEDADLFSLHSGASDFLNNVWNAWNLRRQAALSNDSGGMLWRACTKDYKVMPIRRKVRELMREHNAKHVRSYIGISIDEIQRINTSGVRYITNEHPLIDLGMSRWDCKNWLWEKHRIIPPKSACRYCPYRSNADWKRMRDEQPEEFELACKYDEAIRDAQGKTVRGAGIIGQLFVHRSFTPLRTANLDPNPGQMDFGMEQECEGMCGH